MNVKEVSEYICSRYKKEYKNHIDEMKLHKLLYFSQRESLIMSAKALFDDEFSGWCYGPVMVSIRNDYKNGTISENINYDSDKYKEIKPIMDSVFQKYAEKSSTSLSRISHCEYSWKKSRTGLNERENGNKKIKLNDIAVDAERVRIRRILLEQINNREN